MHPLILPVCLPFTPVNPVVSRVAYGRIQWYFLRETLMHVTPKILAFEDFSYLLTEADSLANPAEIHGILCGLICTGHHLDGKFWFNTVLKLFETRAHISEHHRSIVIDLYDITCRQLSHLHFTDDFQMLLPDENHPLTRRAEALSQWCQGFLYGLRLVQSPENKHSNETNDSLRCISEIAQLDFANIEVRDIDTKAYVGVLDFVRSSVISVYQDLTVQHQHHVKH